ncbi:MAG: zinc-ribbon domain-containing protein [Aureliella sp.]
MPTGAIPADLSQQVSINSYDPPPNWYVDKPFVCVDCGSEEIWTAQQQKWYYETAKGSLYATATRCRQCRSHQRDTRDEQRRRSEAGRESDDDR